MDVHGLESHSQELKSKVLNERGTLRKLFLKYCQTKQFNKAIELVREFEKEYGSVSPGMQASLMSLHIQRREVQPAIDLYEKLKSNSNHSGERVDEVWKLDCFKVYDLVTLMVENQMVDRKFIGLVLKIQISTFRYIVYLIL